MSATSIGVLARLRQAARSLKRDTYTLYYACRDPRTPWYAKVFTGLVVAYALSPIDLIPDFIPVFGYLDDLVLVPLGIFVAVRLIPAEVLADCRATAHAQAARPTDRRAAAAIIAIWILAAALLLRLVA